VQIREVAVVAAIGYGKADLLQYRTLSLPPMVGVLRKETAWKGFSVAVPSQSVHIVVR
jgi:hypothetical protein